MYVLVEKNELNNFNVDPLRQTCPPLHGKSPNMTSGSPTMRVVHAQRKHQLVVQLTSSSVPLGNSGLPILPGCSPNSLDMQSMHDPPPNYGLESARPTLVTLVSVLVLL